MGDLQHNPILQNAVQYSRIFFRSHLEIDASIGEPLCTMLSNPLHFSPSYSSVPESRTVSTLVLDVTQDLCKNWTWSGSHSGKPSSMFLFALKLLIETGSMTNLIL